MGLRKERVDRNDKVQNGDLLKLLEVMANAKDNDFEPVDTALFEDPSVGEQFNRFLEEIRSGNNEFVMRINEAMRKIGDSSCVKEMIEQVNSQAEAITSMTEAEQSIGASIGHISSSIGDMRDNAHSALKTSNESICAMNKSIETVDISCRRFAELNDQFALLNEKIDRINEITDIVKKIAGKSSLLALNASIEAARAGEAGRGFSVVASQMQELAKNTAVSTEDVIRYVGEIRNSVATLTKDISEASEDISRGNTMVQDSVSGIREMSEQITSISAEVDAIFSEVTTQTQLNDKLGAAVKNIADSYQTLSDECLSTGEHLYRICRLTDKVRSDMARKRSKLSTLDWITVFEIDHLIFTWRQYNNLIGYEHLKIEQINQPDGCKLGKWLLAQHDGRITGSAAFKAVRETHYAVHRSSVDCFNAAAAGRRSEALEHFDKAYAAYEKLIRELDGLRDVIRSTGDTDVTVLE